MRYLKIISLASYLFLTLSCDNEASKFNSDIQDGFNLVINDTITYASDQIDFYDFSSHLIYLKDSYTYTLDCDGTFKIYINTDEIYDGNLFPAYYSYRPQGVYIPTILTFYPAYIIPINFLQYEATNGEILEDPRNDERIVSSFKADNKYKAGLSGEILSVQKTQENNVEITLGITNNETNSILYLDPEKMGIALFHYFTTGLILSNTNTHSISHQTSIQEPTPYYAWDINWLSEIKSGEMKTIKITYDNFDTLSSGEYTAHFTFPGLSSQVQKSDLFQNNGRIWLGQLALSDTVNIE
jgi:hypothetical protein